MAAFIRLDGLEVIKVRLKAQVTRIDLQNGVTIGLAKHQFLVHIESSVKKG